MKKIVFTHAALTRLAPEMDCDRVYVGDTKRPGLTLCVTRTGAKSFYFSRKIDGRPERIRLGGFPAMNVGQAREAFDHQIGLLVKGRNPARERRTLRDETTFAELFTRYMSEHAKPFKRTWKADEEMFRRLFGHVASVEADEPVIRKRNATSTFRPAFTTWKTRRLSMLDQQTVRAFHARIGREHGRYAANRSLALVSAMYTFATKIGYAGPNPARGITTFREHSRERFLHPDEMPGFLKALDDYVEQGMSDFFRVCLFTGARRGNVGSMRWSDVNFARRIWTIPASQAKAGDVLSVYLSDATIDVLRRRWDRRTQDEAFVFNSRSECGHLVGPATAWKKITASAGLTDLRVHDLRRTHGSWLAAGGASLPMIGKALGHRSHQATEIYARLNLDPIRAPIEAATAAMRATVSPPAEPQTKTG